MSQGTAVSAAVEVGGEQGELRGNAGLGRYLLMAQGGYYLASGLWPLVSYRTFEMVTGPKTDVWLVKTVGVLAAVIGGALSLAGRRRQVSPEVSLLSVGSAAGFAAIDLVYVLRGRISPVFLLDALVEVAFLGGMATSAPTSLVAPRALSSARPFR